MQCLYSCLPLSLVLFAGTSMTSFQTSTVSSYTDSASTLGISTEPMTSSMDPTATQSEYTISIDPCMYFILLATVTFHWELLRFDLQVRRRWQSKRQVRVEKRPHLRHPEPFLHLLLNFHAEAANISSWTLKNFDSIRTISIFLNENGSRTSQMLSLAFWFVIQLSPCLYLHIQ